jgi:heat shock protein HtpX
MTTTATQLRTRARTWVLVAGFAALMIAFGAILGGTFVWLFAVVAVTVNLVGYIYSDRIALRVARARPLSEADAPELHAIVRELAKRAGIPAPRVFLLPGQQANAFATGRNPAHGAIAVTEGLLWTLPAAQVAGVLAHELAHIRNRDILVSSIAAVMAGAISAIANVLPLTLLFGGEEAGSPLVLFGSLAAMPLAPLGAMLLQLGVSRQREYLADATAARLLGDAAPLAEALEEIEQLRAPALQVSALTAPMYTVNPLAGGRFASLFSTHPPVSERIRRLRAYDGAAARRPRRLHDAAAV